MGRRKMSSVLCQSARDASLATRRGSVTVGSVTVSASGVPASGAVSGVAPCLAAASATCPASAAARKPGRSQTSPKSVAMNGLAAGRCSAGWGGSDAQRASAAGSMGAHRWAVPYLLRVRAGARVRP